MGDIETPVDTGALQSLVFRRRQRIPELDMEFRAPGYLLRVDDEHVDAARFERAVLDAAACRPTDPIGATALLESALALWRGEPYDDLADSDVAQVGREGVDAFGLDSDAKRFARLFFQPVLVIWALGATGAWQAYRAGTWPATPARPDR